MCARKTEQSVNLAALLALVEYAADGTMRWTSDRSAFHAFGMKRAATICAGKPAFTTQDGKGYLVGQFGGVNLRAHRVAWALHNGAWPINEIDHINGNRSDNRIENLRSVTQAENARNKKLSNKNKSGVSGVYFCKRTNQWVAEIHANRTRIYVGRFQSIACANTAVLIARRINGFHPNHGRIEGRDAQSAILQHHSKLMEKRKRSFRRNSFQEWARGYAEAHGVDAVPYGQWVMIHINGKAVACLNENSLRDALKERIAA